ncbi:MAG: cation-transporting P-type ATPase [Candidatus Nomurabacteria bacterium]|jgi:Ca2+-transporting ATPase|nr:cation-transporting P-type ATPase [Candidatus Nomurabacteria bacterium]
MPIFDQTEEELFREFESSGRGLSSAEAKKRLIKYGRNVLKLKTEPLWRRIIEPFADIFMIVLIVAGVLSIIEGNTVDAIIIFAIILINAMIDYVQQFSTERILRSLKSVASQQVSVLRDGEMVTIDSSELVPGDIVALAEGDKVPADGRIVTASEPRADESILTGESELVSKSTKTLTGIKEIYEQSNILFSGTFLISGNVRLLVVRTGSNTEFGKIADLATQTFSISPVQVKINKLVKGIAIVMGMLSVVAFVMSLMAGIDWLESLEFVIALAVSAVPEGLPIAISIILALGMRRMAAKKALVANMRAIETIGVITTIATDKTGTLTMNKLTVQDHWAFNVKSATFKQAVAQALIDPESSHDPLDTAFLDFTKTRGKPLISTTPLATFSFSQALAMSGNVWHEGNKFKLVVKGAPERILDVSNVTESDRELAIHQLAEYTSQGQRVIGIAEIVLSAEPKDLKIGIKGKHLKFIGLVSVADQIRRESHSAVAQARAAGVTVRMITGDHFETAYQIGKKIGIVETRDQVFDCSKLSMLSEADLLDTIRGTFVFSRVTPEAKLQILNLLEKENITAMTGDGVNDVPALAGANVGIAMGSGSYIARDAGDIVLLDDNFKSIVTAMKEGRVIVANIRRMLFYLLSTNAGEVLTMLGALLLSASLPLAPVQILWINIVTDTFFIIPLGLEPAEDNVMKKKPESPDAPILDRHTITRMVLVAITVAIVTLFAYLYYMPILGQAAAGTLAFMALAITQWSNAFNARSSYQSVFTRLKVMNSKFYICLGLAIVFQLAIFIEPLKSWMHVASVPLPELLLVSAISFAAPILVVELHKLAVYIFNTNKA